MPNRRTEPITTICPVCDKPFLVCPPGKFSRTYPRNNQVFCSHPCALRARYRSGSHCKELSPTVAAYIAGFLDADGSIILYKRRKKAALRVSFANCNSSVLEWIAEQTGVGNIVSKKLYSSNHAPAWQLFINSEAAQTFLIQVVSYLHIKQPQAQLAIEFHERLKEPRFAIDTASQHVFRDKLRAMNKRGP